MLDTASDALKSVPFPMGHVRLFNTPAGLFVVPFEPEFEDIIELDTDVGDAGLSVCCGDELIELENECELLYDDVVVGTTGALYVQTILSRSLVLCWKFKRKKNEIRRCMANDFAGRPNSVRYLFHIIIIIVQSLS